MIENRYQPAAVEGRIYAAWEAAGAFRAGRPERASAPPYCIVIPPPNVTGSLHMGHALNNTLQDILCRFERMRGKDVLWQPGTDHAGIATQAVVERQLMERQESSRRMGREAFIKRVWEWKAESGGTIISQLKRLGASCDWSRERFTMDEGLSRAVLKVFVALYREGLIYKDKRLVNWDPKLETAISDLEVVQVETKGQLWHIKYPIEGSDEFIIVATTRPETMLGDVAVAVHPDNERLRHLIGKTAILPLVGRRVPIIGDTYADPEKGTGAVKITPAHDFNDFEVGRRHNLPLVNVLTIEAQLTLALNADFLFGPVPEHSDFAEEYIFLTGVEESPSREQVAKLLLKHGFDDLAETVGSLDGIDRFVARKKIVERLELGGLIDRVEQTNHVVPHGDRSGAVLEPFLTDQWYVEAKMLARPAIEAVRGCKIVFVPPQWEATFFNWMENIQPWCISRQIWWGHQIPCWYGPNERDSAPGTFTYPLSNPERAKRFVCATEAEALQEAKQSYSGPVEVVTDLDEAISRTRLDNKKYYIWRDPDVLDTWFSSALWPFSTLGWPDETPELKRFYPTSTLVTGFDIIFFWVARMMMMGLHFQKDVPFRDVYIHRLVRDASGAKMSKSKGNVVDPLGVIDQYGADALRFTLARGAAQGHDIRLGPQEVENNRNFATKLWNAARFAEINECFTKTDFNPASVKGLINQWIVSQLGDTLGKIELALSDYRFNDAANAIYHFVWSFYCDWYLELTKPIFVTPQSSDVAIGETRATVAYVRDQILKILHPFMPFITEEIWRVTETNRREPMVALSAWPGHQPHFANAHEEIGWLIELVTAVRSVRTEMNVPAGSLIPIEFVNPSDSTRKRAELWDSTFNRLARISQSTFTSKVQPGSAQIIVGGDVAALPLAGVIDLATERARLGKEMSKCDADIARVDQKLNNADFLKRAPEEVVEGEREKREEALARKGKIVEALQRLEAST
jgi:valyl-tRNA synthetase